MPGYRFNLEGLPEQPNERIIPLHRLFLPAGLFLIAVGLLGLYRFVNLKGPPADQIHTLRLESVTNTVMRLDSVWLKTSEGETIRYRKEFPYFSDVTRLNPQFSLLLDSSNGIWGVATNNTDILARSFFEDRNIETKSVSKICGSFCGGFGVLMLILFLLGEKMCRDKDSAKRLGIPLLPSGMVILIGGIFGYLFLFASMISPWLQKWLPDWAVGIAWVLSGGLLLHFMFQHLRKKLPPIPPS